MKKCVNGKYVEMTAEEIAQMRAEAERAEAKYWSSLPYEDAVNEKIRERYTISQEFAILRQRDEKPEEYAEYYRYCEECKTYIKERQGV